MFLLESSHKFHLTIIIFFGCLTGVTLFSHIFIDRYEKNGPEMLTDKWKPHSSKNSIAQIKNYKVYLSSSNQSESVSIQQPISPFDQGSILKLSADAKCENVHPGEKTWNRARILLIQNDGRKDRWDLPHSTVTFSGTRDWKHYSKIYPIGKDTKTLKVNPEIA